MDQNRSAKDMGPFEMVVLIVFIATVGKVAETAVRGLGLRRSGHGQERIDALQAELRANEARLSAAEDRVGELSEKLQFVENLLAKPERSPQLPSTSPVPVVEPDRTA
jgi:hypothetical protein